MSGAPPKRIIRPMQGLFAFLARRPWAGIGLALLVEAAILIALGRADPAAGVGIPATVAAAIAGTVAVVFGPWNGAFVALRSDRRAGGLPVKGGKAVETGRRGELSQIASGASKRLVLRLQPGRYVLLCNLLGHYQAGQFAALRVR